MDLPKTEKPNVPPTPSPGAVSGTPSAAPEKATTAPPVALSAGGEGGGGLRVSLMPSLQGEGGPSMRARVIVLLLVLVVETLLLGTGYFFVVQRETHLKAAQQTLQQQLDGVRGEISDAENAADAMVLFNEQTSAANALLDAHVYWTSVFDFLAAKTKRSVTYRNFSGDVSSGVISMDAVGATYKDVAEQIVVFSEDPQVKSMRTSSAAAAINAVGDVTGVTFSVVLTLDPSVWQKTDFVTLPAEQAGDQPRTAILPVEDQVNAEPVPETPPNRVVVDPGAAGGATSFDPLFGNGGDSSTQ